MQRLMTGTESKVLTGAHLMVSSLMAFLDTLALTDCVITAVPALGLGAGCVLHRIFFYWVTARGKCGETS